VLLHALQYLFEQRVILGDKPAPDVGGDFLRALGHRNGDLGTIPGVRVIAVGVAAPDFQAALAGPTIVEANLRAVARDGPIVFR
jgi:hypothetical protein